MKFLRKPASKHCRLSMVRVNVKSLAIVLVSLLVLVGVEVPEGQIEGSFKIRIGSVALLGIVDCGVDAASASVDDG